jgi:enterochelin esterase-like enzyme
LPLIVSYLRQRLNTYAPIWQPGGNFRIVDGGLIWQEAVMTANMLVRALVMLAMAGWTVSAQARLDRYPDFKSDLVAPRTVTVWVPDSYDPGGARLPVIYMHDGQNLFEPGQAFGGEEWGVDEAMMRRAARGKPLAIVVGIASTAARYREYMPQKIFTLLPDDLRGRIGASHGGEPMSDAYLQFIVTELKPFIDRTYRTRPGRQDTMIMGSSMGGLISLYALGQYPKVFGRAACLSIHWPLIGVSGRDNLHPADVAATAQTVRRYLAASRLRPRGHRLYYDRGDATLDGLYAPYTAAMDAIMPGLGWRRDIDWVSRVFPGAEHSEKSWRERLDIPLSFLLDP